MDKNSLHNFGDEKKVRKSMFLSPKADITFKKVFGEHPDIVKSFLNAMLPLEGREIVEIEYLTPELFPDAVEQKNSIVDVRCKDGEGRQFIVEMQMYWRKEMYERMVFNMAKVYSSQLNIGNTYQELKPIYGLCLLDDIANNEEEFYHHLRISTSDNKIVLDDFHLVLVELPKFKPKTYAEKKLRVLWLRFLTEINEQTDEMPEDMKEDPSLNKALSILQVTGLNNKERLGYDKFVDAVCWQRTLMRGAREDGIEEGMRLGVEKGKKLGVEEGLEKGKLEMARKMKQENMPVEVIQRVTGLTDEEMKCL